MIPSLTHPIPTYIPTHIPTHIPTPSPAHRHDNESGDSPHGGMV